MKSYKYLLAGIALTGSLCGSAFSDSTNTYLLDGITVWDLSGNYSSEVLSLDYSLSEDGKGKLVGSGTALYAETNLNASADFTIKGHVKTRKKGTRLHFVMEGEGSAELIDSSGGDQDPTLPPDLTEPPDLTPPPELTLPPDLVPENTNTTVTTVPFSLSGNCKADLNKQGDMLQGTIHLELVIDEEIIEIKEPFELTIPDGMDGSAVLKVVLNDSAKKLVGSAALTLSNGTELDFSVKGTKKRKDIRIKLTGQGEAKGSRINLRTDAEYNLKKLKGKVMGQKVTM